MFLIGVGVGIGVGIGIKNTQVLFAGKETGGDPYSNAEVRAHVQDTGSFCPAILTMAPGTPG